MTEQWVRIWQKMRKYNFTYLYNSSTVLWTVLGSVFVECEGIWSSPRSHKTDHGKWLSSWWAYGRKCENTSSLSSTTAQPFCERFHGVSSRSLKVYDRVQDHAKRIIGSDWAVGEHMAENAEVQVHLALQRLNRFVNGFGERLHGVWRYPIELRITQNGSW